MVTIPTVQNIHLLCDAGNDRGCAGSFPPPIPAVMNTNLGAARSRWFLMSSILRRHRVPFRRLLTPRPVMLRPSCSFTGTGDSTNAWLSVLQRTNVTSWIPSLVHVVYSVATTTTYANHFDDLRWICRKSNCTYLVHNLMLITSYYLQITSYVSGSYFISSSSLKMLVISSIVFFIFVVNQPGLASLFRLSFSSFSFCLRSFSASLAASLASRSSSSFLSRAMRGMFFQILVVFEHIGCLENFRFRFRSGQTGWETVSIRQQFWFPSNRSPNNVFCEPSFSGYH